MGGTCRLQGQCHHRSASHVVQASPLLLQATPTTTAAATTIAATAATAGKGEANPSKDGKKKGKRAAKDKVKVETDGAVHLSNKVNCHVYVTGLPLVGHGCYAVVTMADSL